MVVGGVEDQTNTIGFPIQTTNIARGAAVPCLLPRVPLLNP